MNGMLREVENTVRLSLIQKIKMKFDGRVYIEHRTRLGWKGSLPFYAFKCPVHGVVIDYPHGHDEYLVCQKCWEEEFGGSDFEDSNDQ